MNTTEAKRIAVQVYTKVCDINDKWWSDKSENSRQYYMIKCGWVVDGTTIYKVETL